MPIVRSYPTNLLTILTACFLSITSYAAILDKHGSPAIIFNYTGNGPFPVTGGPKLVSELEVHFYNNTTCTADSNQFTFLFNAANTPLQNGTYSFSNTTTFQATMCQQVPVARSFLLTAIQQGGSTAVSSCFTFTCINSNTNIACTQTGTLNLSSLT